MVGAGLFVVCLWLLLVCFRWSHFGLLVVADVRFVVVMFGLLMVALGPLVVCLWSGLVSNTPGNVVSFISFHSTSVGR